MIRLLEQSVILLNRVESDFTRFLYDEIDWENKLIGIKGARGTGKTTMLLQKLKSMGLPAHQATYFSLDDMYFTTNSFIETVRKFHKQGGRILFLDEVHKYPNWSREIKNIYDQISDLQIVFTGSSIIDIARQEVDLSRRALMHQLPGLSFREYLNLNNIIDVNKIELESILSPEFNVLKLFPKEFKPYEFFYKYLENGYYPFSKEDQKGFYNRLKQIIRLIVEFDMAELKGFDIRNAKKMLQLMQIIADQVPFKPNLVKLAEKSDIHRNTMLNYIHFLSDAKLINLLYPQGNSISTLQKPEKVFLENTNLMYALSNSQIDKGNIRETFFFNQLSVNYSVNEPKGTDFVVSDRYYFEVGGKNKGKKQIEGLENAFIVKDELEYPIGNTIPLWLFGFLY